MKLKAPRGEVSITHTASPVFLSEDPPVPLFPEGLSGLSKTSQNAPCALGGVRTSDYMQIRVTLDDGYDNSVTQRLRTPVLCPFCAKSRSLTLSDNLVLS